MIFVTDTTPLYHIGFIWSGDKKRMQQDATKVEQQSIKWSCCSVRMCPCPLPTRYTEAWLSNYIWLAGGCAGQDVVHCFIRYLPSYPPHTVIQHTLLQRSHFSIINNIHFLIFTLVCRHLSEKCILVMGWLWFWFIKCMEEKYELMCGSSQDIEVPLSFQKNKTGESLERNREIREATPHNTRVPS